MKNKVHRSIEAPGGGICVDVFQRPDGSWGIEEYRRDPEDGQGWYRTGFLSDQSFQDEQSAVASALEQVPWLDADLVGG